MPGSDQEDLDRLYDLDPADIEPGSRVQKLPSRGGGKLSGAVPVRFPADTIEAIKRLADEQSVTVSAWIRYEIDQALTRAEATTPQANVVQIEAHFDRRRVAAARRFAEAASV